MLKRQRFSAEFKRETVRQLRESGKQVAVLSRELGAPRNRQVGGRC
jgi:transposase